MAWKNVQYENGKYRTSEGGGGGGSSTFAGLDDVDFSNLQNGQVPKYNSTTGKWENANESGGGGTVTDVEVDGVSVVNQQGVAEITMPTPPTIPVEDVEVNGESVVNAQKVAEIKSYKEVTQAEYNALPDSKLNDGILYAIKDSAGADGFPPLIYSDEEREVGVWRDGKPLYEKTWEFDNAITITSNSWTDVPISNSMIEGIIGVKGYNLYSGKISCWNGFSATADSGTYVKILQNRNASAVVKYLTLQYTKTTDTAGSGTWTTQGGYAHHYSTTEHVIGTWIDGKPLYEKTVHTGAIRTSNVAVAHNIQNLKDVVYIKGYCKVDGGSFIPLPFVQGNSGITNYQVRVDVNTTNVTLSSVSLTDGADSYITIRYTKTTD